MLELGELINKIPEGIKHGGSVNDVREWRRRRELAAKLAGNKRASVSDIRSAISSMLGVAK